jgi:hypothetical protein
VDTHALGTQPLARHYAIDERGTLLRATWRPEHGFVNLSLWRDDVCVETFHLSPTEAASLMSFLARSLADAVSQPLSASASSGRIPADQAASTPRPGHPRRRRWAITSLTNWSGWRRKRRPE